MVFLKKLGLKWDQFNWLFAIGIDGCCGNGLGLFGSCGSSATSAGMFTGWCGSSVSPGHSAKMSKGCSWARMFRGGLGSWGCSAGVSRGWFGGWCGKSTSESSESELTTMTALPDFFFALWPLPAPLPLTVTCVFYTDFALGLTALEAMGIHLGKCTDLDLILGLPALDVDAMDLSAIRHSTICQKFCCHF